MTKVVKRYAQLFHPVHAFDTGTEVIPPFSEAHLPTQAIAEITEWLAGFKDSHFSSESHCSRVTRVTDPRKQAYQQRDKGHEPEQDSFGNAIGW
ncbi:hypothetical protein [Sphingomonas swuensis]|uniref:hypothetical protein n=1 Tax=Sphingomonas swuensis TaxID=977800 RepID=UPI0031D82594